MSQPTNPLDLEAATKAIEIASKELAHLCDEKWKGRDGWHWEIPANPERDTDLRIAEAIGVAKDAVAEIHSLREEITRLKASDANWMEQARQFCGNMEYYRGLLDECAKHLGEAVYIQDDGGISDSVLRAKLPELVAKLAEGGNKETTP